MKLMKLKKSIFPNNNKEGLLFSFNNKIQKRKYLISYNRLSNNNYTAPVSSEDEVDTFSGIDKFHQKWKERTNQKYDLLILGSGPAGQKAAIHASKMGKKVGIIDAAGMIGGVCLNTGTIPSKSMREAILSLSGFRQRNFYGKTHMGRENLSFQDLTQRVNKVIKSQYKLILEHFDRNDVDIIYGWGSFLDPHTIKVDREDGNSLKLKSDKILIACGTRPARKPEIPCDGEYIFDSDQILSSSRIPTNLITVGAGVIGLEYSSMLSSLSSTKSTIIESRDVILDFIDKEIIGDLTFHMKEYGAKFRLGEAVTSVHVDKKKDIVVAKLASGKKVIGDSLLYAVGRQCNTDRVGIHESGLTADNRGKLVVNEYYQTSVPHIYAAGDVIGFPSLASSSVVQGRLAACHMFGKPLTPIKPELIPYGIYTIPEISMVGKTEQTLTKEKVPYEYGISKFSELEKGMMYGDAIGGMLKILFHQETRDILGVHCIGESATEIIHIGQAAMASGAKVDFFKDTIFNFPTFVSAYQVASLDGFNKLMQY